MSSLLASELRKAEQNLLERTEMRMLRWMMGIKRIEKNRNEEIRARADVANISYKIREARPRWLGHVERKTEKEVVMRTWKLEVGRHRNIGKRKSRWSDVIRKDMREKGVKERRSTRPENVEIENTMYRPQIGTTPEKESLVYMTILLLFNDATFSEVLVTARIELRQTC